MPRAEHLLWIDLETTGVDEKLDPIIEVGAILTNMELVELSTYSTILVLPERGWKRLQENEYVLNMHTENGLLEDIKTYPNSELPTTYKIEREILNWLESEGVSSHKVMLAGSGVSHFDRRFLKVQMPKLEQFLAYPNLDIGVMRRFASEICGVEVPAFNEGKTHRGLKDVRCHLQEAEWFRGLLVDGNY